MEILRALARETKQKYTALEYSTQIYSIPVPVIPYATSYYILYRVVLILTHEKQLLDGHLLPPQSTMQQQGGGRPLQCKYGMSNICPWDCMAIMILVGSQ